MERKNRIAREPDSRLPAGDSGQSRKIDRRTFLARGAALTGAAAATGLATGASAQDLAGQPWERVYGAGFTGYGQPSRFEQPVVRHIGRPYGDLAPGSGASLTPIESLEGTITPSGAALRRRHNGVPDIDPTQHRLLIHGLVKRPLMFSMEALWRYPMTTRIYFVECSGNSNRNPRARSRRRFRRGAIHGTSRLQRVDRRSAAHAARGGGPAAARRSGCSPRAPIRRHEPQHAARQGARRRDDRALPERRAAAPRAGLPGAPAAAGMGRQHEREVAAAHEGHRRGRRTPRTKRRSTPTCCPDGKALQFTFEMGVKSVITRPSFGDEAAARRASTRSPASPGRARAASGAWKSPPTAARRGRDAALAGDRAFRRA